MINNQFNNPWTINELTILKQYGNILFDKELHKLLIGRTWKAIQLKLFRLNIKRGHHLRDYHLSRRKDVIENFMSRIDFSEDGCWYWTGLVFKDGYGQFAIRDKTQSIKYRAHRLSYQIFIGEIPNGLVLDHLCSHITCVNPDHLEPVSNKENIIRGIRRIGVDFKDTNHPLRKKNRNARTVAWRWLKNKDGYRNWDNIFGYSRIQLRQYIAKLFDSNMNWDNYGSYWHLDHIKPIVWCDSFEEAWSLSNLRPLSSKENMLKNMKFL